MIKPLTPQKCLSPDELTRLKRTISPENPSRDDLLIQVALATGGRASELLAINSGDVTISGKSAEITIYGIKGSNDRAIPIPLGLARALVELGERPFPISYSRLAEVWDIYRPNGKKFHALRHTFAVNLYEKTRNLITVRNALGHKDIKNTMIYLEYVETRANLRKALLG